MLFSLTNPEVAILMMGIFLFAVLLGFPIAFTLMAMGIGFGYYAFYDPALMDHIFDNRIFQLFVICLPHNNKTNKFIAEIRPRI